MSKKLQALQNNNELRGLKIARGVKNANHSQFADDTILLGGASVIIAEIFKEVISTFLKDSDGKFNAAKTKIYGWNFPTRTMARIARILGYEATTNWNSFRYLGISIHKGIKKKSRLEGICSRNKE